eukprot:5704532-Prymnesium_polylepis.1
MRHFLGASPRGCRDRVRIAVLACDGSSRSRIYMPPSARSVLDDTHLATRASSERRAPARKSKPAAPCRP